MKKRRNIEKEITKALIGGSVKAIDIIYENYYRNLFSVAYGVVKDYEAAKDVMQEAIIKIWLSSKEYNPELSSPYTWMYRIVKNKAIDNYRTKKYVAIPERMFFATEMKVELLDFKDHVSGLNSDLRPFIDMTLKGYTHAEMSKIFNMPLGTVKGRIQRGKKKLKTIYTNAIDEKKQKQKHTLVMYA